MRAGLFRCPACVALVWRAWRVSGVREVTVTLIAERADDFTFGMTLTAVFAPGTSAVGGGEDVAKALQGACALRLNDTAGVF